MREIKFRAWFENRMHNIIGMNLKFKIAHSKYGSIPFKETEGILMQFTGLQDENGVDIYEGDIVKVHIKTIKGEFDRICEVIFENGEREIITGGEVSVKGFYPTNRVGIE